MHKNERMRKTKHSVWREGGYAARQTMSTLRYDIVTPGMSACRQSLIPMPADDAPGPRPLDRNDRRDTRDVGSICMNI